MLYYIYILQIVHHSKLYIGYSSDLKKRVISYNAGKNKATKPFIPYRLIYYEAFLSLRDAKQREIYLKSGWSSHSKEDVKKLLDGATNLTISPT